MINKIIASIRSFYTRNKDKLRQFNSTTMIFPSPTVIIFLVANNESRVDRVALFHLSFARKGGERGGRGGWVAAFTSDKIPANLSTLQPQRQNSSVEIGDRGEPVMEGGA